MVHDTSVVIRELEKFLDNYFYHRFTSRNMIPKVKNSCSKDILNKLIFYSNLEIRIERSTQYDSYETYVVFIVPGVPREKSIQWRYLVSDSEISEGIDYLTSTLSKQLDWHFGEFPNTKASRALYGI